MFLRQYTKATNQKAVPWFIIPLVALLFLSKCASDQSAQGEDPVEQGSGQQGVENTSLNGNVGESENSADADALGEGAAMNNASDSGTGNNFSAESTGNNEFGNSSQNAPWNNTATNENAALGASLNNVPFESDGALNANPGAALNQAVNPLNATATPLNNGVNALSTNATQTTAPEEVAETVPAETTPQTINPVATSYASGARAATSPFSNPQMNWPGKGKVKYVTRPLTRHTAPNGPILGEFEQGEHPLIFQNGNWVELHDGSFVKGNGLSEKAVGYNKGKKLWQ
jgi:hypothetical protein